MSTSDSTTLEIVNLEGLLSDECKCQAKVSHQQEGIPCSVEVTHRITYSCGATPVLVCFNSAQRSVRAIYANEDCGRCGIPCSECWHVNPV